MSEGSGSFPSLSTVPAGLSGSDRLPARQAELWLRSKFLFLPGDPALLSSKAPMWYNCSFICTGREFVIPSGNWRVQDPLSWMLAQSLRTLRPGRKPSPVETDRHAIAALTIRLDKDFNSLRSESLTVITRQNLPCAPMKLGPAKGDPLAKIGPSPVFTTESFSGVCVCATTVVSCTLISLHGRGEELHQNACACKAYIVYSGPPQEKRADLQFNREAIQERRCGVLKDPEKGLNGLNSGSASSRNQLANNQMSLPVAHHTEILWIELPMPNWLPDTFHFQKKKLIFPLWLKH